MNPEIQDVLDGRTGGCIVCGDCLAVLRTMPDECVDCCVTSPPYWGLRDYGIEPSVWGGDATCEHAWGDVVRIGGGKQNEEGKRWQHTDGGVSGHGKARSDVCSKCGAWRGVFGLEPTPELYVEHSVEIFREVRRVLADSGTVFLNLGDSYASGKGKCFNPGGGAKSYIQEKERYPLDRGNVSTLHESGLKPKDLVGIPWRVAFALQADGWWLRQDIILSKRNPMPESVTDRCTKSHEYFFLLTKKARYYFDNEAIKEDSECNRMRGPAEHPCSDTNGNDGLCRREVNGSRNRRSVWEVVTEPTKEAHFATFGQKWVEPCILAGCPREVCRVCGKPRERTRALREAGMDHDNPIPPSTTVGWTDCGCGAGFRAGIVMDPFGGSGTVGVVAARLKRDYVLIELNPKYIEDIAKPRLAHVEMGVPVAEQRAGQMGLFK